MTPLNGEKIHPLTAHAKGVLRLLSCDPRPSQEINPGVIRRLLCEGLIEIVDLESPYKTHKGGTCKHARITRLGRSALIDTPAKHEANCP